MSPKVKFVDGKSRGGHSHTLIGQRPGSPKTFGCGHKVTERFLVWSQAHKSFFGVVTRSLKDFWCGHRVTKVFQQKDWS